MAFGSDSSSRTLHELSKATLKSICLDPSPYSLTKSLAEEPQIPSLEVFRPLDTSPPQDESEPLALPSPAECAVHLELLETIYVIRQRILKSEAIDKTFGIEPNHKEVTRRNGEKRKLKDDTLWERRQVKWQKYVEFAVARFLYWKRRGLNTLDNNRPSSGGLQITQHTLPPLDVIIIWHSFLLNPRLFRDHCQRNAIYNLSFPWRHIHQAINNYHWTFTLSREASRSFETSTGLASDLFDQLCSWPRVVGSSSKDLAALSMDSPPQMPSWVLNVGSSHFIRQHLEAFCDMDKSTAIRLRDAVFRQSKFVDKMHDYLWIRSPALDGTLRRAIDRYDKFLKLFKLYPTTMFVPALDIDLVWHTHQCVPSKYFETTRELAGKFVNHNDKMAKGKLDDGFERTQSLFYVRFGKEYAICGCWDCEALSSALENAVGSLDGQPDMDKIVKKVNSDVSFHRVAEFQRRNKKGLPMRE